MRCRPPPRRPALPPAARPPPPCAPRRLATPSAPPSASSWEAPVPPFNRPPWRLQADLPPTLALVLHRIESAWAAHVRGVAPTPLRSDWEWADSGVRSDPRARLRLENRAYASPAFRKLHLEAAVRDDGLAVLHCVLYPRLELGGGGFPILSLDAVAARDTVTLAIVDPCPACMDGGLPPAYDAAADAVGRSTGLPPSNRGVPDWGAAIFSRHCALTRPADTPAFLQWASYALTLHEVHLALADAALGKAGASAAARHDTAAAHARYAASQLANAKTRRVLEAAFGVEWAAEYMAGCMFDVEAE